MILWLTKGGCLPIWIYLQHSTRFLWLILRFSLWRGNSDFYIFSPLFFPHFFFLFSFFFSLRKYMYLSDLSLSRSGTHTHEGSGCSWVGMLQKVRKMSDIWWSGRGMAFACNRGELRVRTREHRIDQSRVSIVLTIFKPKSSFQVTKCDKTTGERSWYICLVLSRCHTRTPCVLVEIDRKCKRESSCLFLALINECSGENLAKHKG